MENKVIIRYIKMYHANICDWQSLNIVQQNVLIDLVRTWFEHDRLTNKKKRYKSILAIRVAVCEFYKIDNLYLDLRTRKRDFAEPRQVAHYLARNYTKLSLERIGWSIGNVNHSTVLHSIKTVSNLLESNKEFQQKFNQIKSKL